MKHDLAITTTIVALPLFLLVVIAPLVMAFLFIALGVGLLGYVVWVGSRKLGEIEKHSIRKL